jgi:DNA-binding CsgD family transcriptional regulator
VVAAADVGIVGRDAELARLREFAVSISERAGAIVVRGDAGIGKTVLWRAGLDAAEHAGVRALVTRCAEVEMPLALGGLGDLLDRAFADVANELAEPQRKTLGVALGLEAPPEETPDQIALPRAFVACLRAMAHRAPVLVAIDDIQWLDAPSQRILAFALKRLDDAPVGILATQRGDEDDPLDLRHALDERFAEIRLGPLSVGALHHLVRTRLAVRIPRPLLARVHQASGGNPMFALEFARVVAAQGRAATSPLPVPASLEHLVRERVAAYPPDIRALLAVAAAVEHPTPQLLEAAIDGAGPLLDEACETGAVAIDEDGIVRFTHPLLASAAYAALAPLRRYELHARLAALSDDPEAHARQLALSSAAPDPEVARALDVAAADVRSRGAPDAAAELARHAARLTPSGHRVEREERSLAAIAYLLESARVAESIRALDELLGSGISGPRRARALVLRAFPETDGEKTTRLAEDALEHVGDEAVQRIEVLLYRSWGFAVQEGDVVAAEESTRRALAAAEEVGDPAVLSSALGQAGALAAMRGRPEPALMERAIRLAATHGRKRAKGLFHTARWRMLRASAARQRLWAGDLAGARTMLEEELETLRGRGIFFERSHLHRDLADVEWRAGNWERAEHHLALHEELTFDGGDRFHEVEGLWQQGLLAASRGRVGDARRLAHESIEHGQSLHWPWQVVWGRWVLGFLALSLDEPADASDALAEVPDLLVRSGIGEPGLWPLQPDAIEAQVAHGRLDEADRLLTTLDEQALALEHRWAKPAALRCRGLLLLARGESEAAVAAAEKATRGFEAAGFPLDRGRALLAAGEALRRLGERRRAAEKLDAASAIFAELGAPLWAERAAKELSRARPRPRRDRELTSAERQVAALVAAGKKNREVASQLFTTVATVEAHLTRIYRKLGVRSRTELARQVADGTLSLNED